VRQPATLRHSEASRAVWLRSDAEKVSGALPPLLAEADRLAATVAMGLHGRRRAGPGETFWQYRRAVPGDTLTDVDWRRSARSDHLYIREMEWEAAQSVSIWADQARAMDYRGSEDRRTKGERAALLALALSVLLIKGGERVALMGTKAARPRAGENQLRRMAVEMARDRGERQDFGAPPPDALIRGGRAVFLSDFMGPRAGVFAALEAAAGIGVSGTLVQILDDSEEAFPFDGRTMFESMGGTVRFETQRARALRTAYQTRLAERRDSLQAAARNAGWRCLFHRTSESPRKALLWLFVALGGMR